ncbi:MAG: 16S rRNA (cytosine(1402)-N(4))-methyltransferase RsmH [Candidatus Omnitrophica bacterium]|nr:16S rRNA (cytosine(1402)-N(4))-methyltransferase RsmH [Candidatus Omnitrophota bacterium]
MTEPSPTPLQPSPFQHAPVLLKEIIECLAPTSHATVVDCTVGLGGHSLAVLPRLMPSGRLIAIDCDAQALERAKNRLIEFAPHVELVQGNFQDLPMMLQRLGCSTVDGVIADLGMSSLQVDDAQRGFSFLRDGPLDMRMDPRQSVTAASLIQQLSQRELTDLLWTYGEERWAGRIARRIVETRKPHPIETTSQLAHLIERVIPLHRGTSRIHPATRTFQALRIVVNDELAALKRLLEVLPDVLAPGGRAVIIAFHSLEDRAVKQAFRQEEQTGVVRVLTKKPIRPSETEIAANPRSRSARLRAVEKLQ